MSTSFLVITVMFLTIIIRFTSACNALYIGGNAIKPLDVCKAQLYANSESSSKYTCDSNGDAVKHSYDNIDCSGSSIDKPASSMWTVTCDSYPCEYAIVRHYYFSDDCDSSDHFEDKVFILNECESEGNVSYNRKCSEDTIDDYSYSTNDCTEVDNVDPAIIDGDCNYDEKLGNNVVKILHCSNSTEKSEQCLPRSQNDCWDIDIIQCVHDKYGATDTDKYSYIQLIFNYIFIPITSLCTLTVIISIYVFIKNYCSNRHQLQKQLFYIGLLFLIISLLAISGLIVWRVLLYHGICEQISSRSGKYSVDGYKSFWDYGKVYFFIYYFQGWLLSVILFLRVYMIFKDTVFNLSKHTVRIYFILFCLYPIYCPMIPGIWIFDVNTGSDNTVDGYRIRAIWLASGYVLMLLFTLSLTILFISKLFRAYSGLETVRLDGDILKTVTKTTILQITSSIPQSIVPIFVARRYYKNEYRPHEIFEADIGILLDVYTNFLCIIMSYAFFNRLYLTLCGFVDKRCRVCWFKYTTRTEPHNADESVELSPIRHR